MQIVIKPEAADTSTQTPWTDQASSSAASTSAPSIVPTAPLATAAKQRTRGVQLISDYSKKECECENCRSSYVDHRGLGSVTLLAVPLDSEAADGPVPTSSGVDSSTGVEQSDWQRIEELPQVYGAPSSESSGSDDYDGQRCYNDGCRKYACEWTYPECESCWREHQLLSR